MDSTTEKPIVVTANSRKDSGEYFRADRVKLINWVNERPSMNEKKARLAVFVELNIDGFLNDFCQLQDFAKGSFTGYDELPVVIGNPSKPAINSVEALLKKSGTTELSIEDIDSVSGENIKTTVGICEEDRHHLYFAEEIGADGRVISRAVVDTGHNYETATEDEGGYQYRLELHYTGEEYKKKNAEVDIDSASSPRATAKTMELLTNKVSKSVEK